MMDIVCKNRELCDKGFNLVRAMDDCSRDNSASSRRIALSLPRITALLPQPCCAHCPLLELKIKKTA